MPAGFSFYLGVAVYLACFYFDIAATPAAARTNPSGAETTPRRRRRLHRSCARFLHRPEKTGGI